MEGLRIKKILISRSSERKIMRYYNYKSRKGHQQIWDLAWGMGLSGDVELTGGIERFELYGREEVFREFLRQINEFQHNR